MINQDGFRLITTEAADAPAVIPAPPITPNPALLAAQGTRPRSASTTSAHENHAAIKDERLTWEVTSLDDLKPLGFIGKGACGLVKRVLHVPSQRVLAVKIIPLDVDEKVRKQILLELRTLYNTVCPNIVPYHGAFYRDGAFYLVLEYMDAGSLADIIRKTRGRGIPERVIGHMAKGILNGLVYMNKEHHLLHRDIKPSNLLLSRKGDVMISDLGLVGQLANSMENAMSFVGTVLYMSPERIQGKEYSFACDVWSLGLTFYECALGRYPFEPSTGKKHLEFFDVFHYIVAQPLPPLSREQFSEDFCDFIERCLMKEPEQRPTAAKLLDHPFIQQYANDDQFDLGAWVRDLLDNESQAQ